MKWFSSSSCSWITTHLHRIHEITKRTTLSKLADWVRLLGNVPKLVGNRFLVTYIFPYMENRSVFLMDSPNTLKTFLPQFLGEFIRNRICSRGFPPGTLSCVQATYGERGEKPYLTCQMAKFWHKFSPVLMTPCMIHHQNSESRVCAPDGLIV